MESERQRTRLWEFGCPWGQGHLFAQADADRESCWRCCDAGRGGKPGRLAEPLHEAGAVIRISTAAGGRAAPAGRRRYLVT